MGQAIGAIAGGVGSLFGGAARRREERQAQAQFDSSRDARDNFNFRNNYLGLENTADDLTVNQQAANFEAQQADTALAGGLDAIVQSGGGGGGAQAIANAALASRQGISASIAQQEQANSQARIAQASQNQLLERQGAERQQGLQYDRIGNQLGESSQRLGAAKAARAKATQDLIGGIAGVGSVVAGGLIGGGTFGENLGANFGFGGEGGFGSEITDARQGRIDARATRKVNRFAQDNNIGFGPGQFNLLGGL